MAAFEAAQVEPLDFETPGRVVEVPVPPEHFNPNDSGETAPAVRPKSRFDVVREYLEANRQQAPQPTTPEVDVAAAREADARRDFGSGMLAAGQAFTGNRRAVGQLPTTNTNEAQAVAANEARKRELEQWAAGRERQRMGEAGLLGQALSADEAAKQREAQAGLGRERLELDKTKATTADENADLDREAKAKAAADKLAAAKAKAAAAAGASPDEVRFEDMTFQFIGSPSTPKDVRVKAGNKMREVAVSWAVASSAMSELESAMREFQKNPSLANRGMLFAPALTAAGAVNAAIGQGAMSDAEKQAQFQGLGINLSDPASVQALLEKDPEGFVKRVLGAKKLARASITASARSLGYDPKAAAPQAAGGAVEKPPEGKVAVVDPETGETLMLSPAAAARLKAKVKP